MLKQRTAAAKAVAKDLFEAERAIDMALAKTAKLPGTIAIQRNRASLSVMIGHGAIERALAAASLLGNARRAIIEAHEELSEAKIHAGLRTLDVGDGIPKPPKEAVEPVGLHIVAAA